MPTRRLPRARLSARTSAHTDRCLLIAHRGDSSRAPENTLSAFTNAEATGVDGIELDVRLSADGMVVVCHDAHLARFGGSHRSISRTPLSVLRRANVGSWFHPRFAAERIPTLTEILDRFRGLLVLIEIKAASGPGRRSANRRLVDAVVKDIARAQAAERVLVLCFDRMVLVQLARVAPHLRLVRNCERTPKKPGPWLDLQPHLSAVCVDQRALTPDLIAQAHARGLAVLAYACNDTAVLARLRPHHIDGLLSDRPAWLMGRLHR